MIDLDPALSKGPWFSYGQFTYGGDPHFFLTGRPIPGSLQITKTSSGVTTPLTTYTLAQDQKAATLTSPLPASGDIITVRMLSFRRTRSAVRYLNHLYVSDLVSNLLVAYSLGRVVRGYAGNAVQISRSGDGATSDFGFVGDGFDWGGAVAWVIAGGGTQNGYITKWYDQGGTTNDFIQPTSNRPLLITSGVANNEITFNSSTHDYLPSTSGVSVSNTALTIFTRQRGATTGADPTYHVGIDAGFNGSVTTGFAHYYVVSASKFRTFLGHNGSSGYAGNDWSYTPTALGTLTFLFDTTQGAAVDQVKAWWNGTALTPTPSFSSLQSGNIANTTRVLGGNGSSYTSDMAYTSYIECAGDQTANRAAVEALLY